MSKSPFCPLLLGYILLLPETKTIINMSKKNQIKLADLSNKKVLTSRELAVYTGWSLSYIYKLTMSNTIPYSKPNGKTCFFDREEIERYLMGARVQTQAEVEAQAQKIGRV